MTPETIPRHAPIVLTNQRREAYFHTGYLATIAHLDPTPCPVPPGRARAGYGSIYSVQRVEEMN